MAAAFNAMEMNGLPINPQVPSSAVDVLVPIKPIKDFVEFDCCFKEATGLPVYRFEVSKIDALLQRKTQLRGKEFQVPGSKFLAQIEVRVHYDQFTLSIRFLDRNKQEPVSAWAAMSPVITTVIINRNKCYGGSNHIVTHVTPFDVTMADGSYYPFCVLSYRKKLKNLIDSFSSSVTLHLYVRCQGFSLPVHLPDGSLLWRLDASQLTLHPGSGFEEEKQLASSPFVSKQMNGVRVQLRLFFKDRKCLVEVRALALKQSSDRHCPMSLTLIHQTDSSERIVMSFTPFDVGQKEREPGRGFEKASRVLVLSDIDQLISYIYMDKLLFALEMMEQ